jgi:hypothetical protein
MKCVAVLFLVVHVVAMGAVAPVQAAPADARLAAVERTVGSARQRLATGSLAEAVRAAAELAEVDAVEPGAAAASGVGVAVPAALQRPVTRLVAAMRTAEQLVARAIPNDPRLVRTAADDIAFSELVARATATPDADRRERILARAPRHAEELVDEQLLYQAGVVVAAAIDASLPELHRVAHQFPGRGGVAGCDVADLPVVCIGGDGANTYTKDTALVIDLGGDDVHTHAAGGASPLQNGLPVAVTVDVGGKDRYERSSGVAQGGGNLGVGMLVDDGDGDDIYSIKSTKSTESAIGQGSTLSAGGGLLADMGGDDTYTLTSTSVEAASAAGHGRAGQPGFAILLDQGAGNDAYTISARPSAPTATPTEVKVPGLNANGMGLGGLSGVGVLSDGGGTDVQTLEAVAATVSPEESRPVTGAPVTGPSGFGTGVLGGVGLVLSGNGPTTRTVTGSVQAPWSGIVTGNVFGRALEAVGVLIDQGGDDSYIATSSSRAIRNATIHDGCACDGVRAEAKTALPGIGAAALLGMGSATVGVGLVRDEGGNDVYRASVEALAAATVDDRRSGVGPDGTAGTNEAVATAATVLLSVQATSEGGVGVLHDLAGNDVYEATDSSRATAHAESAVPGAAQTARAFSEKVFTSAQAAATASGGVPGFALLRDDGGTDRYAATSESTATASPQTQVLSKDVLSSAQASVANQAIAILQDRDDSRADVFSLLPADSACSGTRGGDTWQDCGQGVGMGSTSGPPPSWPTPGESLTIAR